MLNLAIENIDAATEELRAIESQTYVVAWDKALLRQTNSAIGLRGARLWYGTLHRANFVADGFRKQASAHANPGTIRVLSPREGIELLQSYRAELVRSALHNCTVPANGRRHITQGVNTMSNTNGMTLSQFRAELRAAYAAGGLEAQRAKRKEMLAGFGPKVDINPYGRGSYTVSPRGYIFSCGTHVFADFGYQPERNV